MTAPALSPQPTIIPATLEDALGIALHALNTGDPRTAARITKQLRQRLPDCVEAIYIEGLSAIRQNRLWHAESLLQTGQDIFNRNDHNRGFAAHLHGRLLLSQGRVADALPHLETAASLQPGNAEIWLDCGECLALGQKADQAEQAYLRAFALQPGRLDTLRNIFTCAWVQGAFDRAATFGMMAFALQPDPLMALNIARTWIARNRIAEARQWIRTATQHDAPALDLLLTQAALALAERKHSRAIQLYRQAYALAPGHPALPRLLAATFLRNGDITDSIHWFGEVLKRNPDETATLVDLASVQIKAGQLKAATASLAHARQLEPGNPDAIYATGCLQLHKGQWAEGWKNYESRWQASWLKDKYHSTVAPLQSPMWDGKADLNGKRVMAMCEQGAGDLIQFARYCRHLAERGATVDLLAPPDMAELLASTPFVNQVHDNYFRIPPHDHHISLLSCPGIFGTTPDTIPPPAQLVAPKQRPRFSDRFTVGLVWAGDPTNPDDSTRSIPFRFLGRLWKELPNVTFVSLQVGPRNAEAARAIRAGHLLDGTTDIKDWSGTAAAIKACDLVLSVCTGTLHLAASLGHPTALMLSTAADWRWFAETHGGTGWYPDMAVLRQKRLNDWDGVMDQAVKLIAAASAH